jgi:tetratricopeptide (TPR) repeat protein
MNPVVVNDESKYGTGLIRPKTRSLRSSTLELLVSLSLILLTLIVYWPVQHYEFVDFDDDVYVFDNPHVKNGLTLQGLVWDVTATHSGNWHPLTWLSHQLDCTVYGLNPGGHHLTNVLFHIANTVLLFLVFKRMSGALWASAFIAALFALHPLHVESVAWVAERKDVLSAFFWILTMLFYVYYTERPGLSRYLLVLLSLALGLLSKPMVVTLPFVLLLLDYWPLGRFRIEKPGDPVYSNTPTAIPSRGPRSSTPRLLLEKVPLLTLSAVSSYLTFYAQAKAGAVKSLELFPLGTRVANALVAYVGYIWKAIWPYPLAHFYPYPDTVSFLKVGGACLLLAGISAVAILNTCRRPYLLVGWLWYLGTLVPVIGLVQVGHQALADRYTYVPLIGLFIIIAMGIPDILSGWRRWRTLLAVSGGLILIILMIATRLQLQHWRNGIEAYQHTLAVTSRNYIVHNNLGIALFKRGKIPDALIHFKESVQINPRYAAGYNNIGVALAREGKIREAIPNFCEAMRLNPAYGEARVNLISAYFMAGDRASGLKEYEILKSLAPDVAKTLSYEIFK